MAIKKTNKNIYFLFLYGMISSRHVFEYKLKYPSKVPSISNVLAGNRSSYATCKNALQGGTHISKTQGNNIANTPK
jgi:hypothetical protein